MTVQRNFFASFEDSEKRLSREWMESKNRTEPTNAVTRDARSWHESKHHRADALVLLRNGEELTERRWKIRHPGSRLAPVIDKLRNAHGFDIVGEGNEKKPYALTDRRQRPGRVEVTEAIKEAYYLSSHWIQKRQIRMEHDRFSCVLCEEEASLQVHHVVYNLFAERNRELMTVCKCCHQGIHEASRLAFPSGMKTEHVERLGIPIEFEEWLL